MTKISPAQKEVNKNIQNRALVRRPAWGATVPAMDAYRGTDVPLLPPPKKKGEMIKAIAQQRVFGRLDVGSAYRLQGTHNDQSVKRSHLPRLALCPVRRSHSWFPPALPPLHPIACRPLPDHARVMPEPSVAWLQCHRVQRQELCSF